MTVSVYYELDSGGAAYDDYNLVLGMGDMGSLSFSGNSKSGSGVDKLKDIVPNAYTPIYEATDSTDSGLIDASGNNQAGQWGYDIAVGSLDLSLSYNPEPAAGKTAETGFAVVYNGLMDGLELSAGMFDDGDTAENDTIGVKYTMGSVTAAYQMTKVDYEATGSTDQDADHYGVSIAINDALSVSYNDEEFEATTNVAIVATAASNTKTKVESDMEVMQVAYIFGGATLGAHIVDVANADYVSGKDEKMTVFTIAMDF